LIAKAGLIDWISYALDTCIDRERFMRKLLNVGVMREHIQAALIFEDSKKTGERKEAALALHYLFSTNSEMGRAAFKQMTGLGERVATDLNSSLLKNGYLATDSAYGALRFGIWSTSFRHTHPALFVYLTDVWPEAEADDRLSQGYFQHSVKGFEPLRFLTPVFVSVKLPQSSVLTGVAVMV